MPVDILSPQRELALTSILEGARTQNITPGGVLLVGNPSYGAFKVLCNGTLGRTREITPVTQNSLYDLASLTKLVSTLHLLLILMSKPQEGSTHPPLTLSSPLQDLSPQALNCPSPKPALEIPADLKGITLRDLLSHQSGLPPWRPLYLNPGSLNPQERKERALKAILSERLQFRPGESTLYSDLGFILLGFIVEENQNKTLSPLFKELISDPLGLASTLYSPKLIPPGKTLPEIAPTEDGFRRGGPLDYLGAPILGPVPPGHPHDDNAGFLSGAAGHAGLFSVTEDLFIIVKAFAKALSSQNPTVSQELIKECLIPQKAKDGSQRPLGFDMLQLKKGALFGHLGYTGVTLWWSHELDRVL
ncbi:MAG: beta-lactamase family protein, partial [Deltaproteobacteria bacterium]|nr:beta-lactamase family protein [Deltaproteobacteria bacterium]